MKLYTGIDLHSNNSYLAIIDEGGRKVFKKKLSYEPDVILEVLKPFKERISGIVVNLLTTDKGLLQQETTEVKFHDSTQRPFP